MIGFIVSGCAGNYGALSGMSEADRYQATRYKLNQDTGPNKLPKNLNTLGAVPVAEPRSPGGNKSPYVVRGKTYRIIDRPLGWTESGVASWYGAKFHGHKTSNGEIFDMYKVSAAHKSLPIPTYIKVTNLDNGRSVIARVNDRGPFHDGRVVDLSYAGAAALGYQNMGTARVQIEVVGTSGAGAQVAGSKTTEYEWLVQLGAFSDQKRAEALVDKVKRETSYVAYIDHAGLYRVRIGPYGQKKAEKIVRKLRRTSLGPPILVKR